MSDDDTLAAVQDVFFSFQRKLSMMLIACKTQDQHDQIVAQYNKASDRYYACVDQTFAKNDPQLASLVTQAQADAAAIKAIDLTLGKITKVIDIVTDAASTVASIAAKVVAA